VNDDELSERLRRADPAGDVSVDPVDGPRAARLMEKIMQTVPPQGPEAPDVPVAAAPPPRRHRWAAFVAGGVAAVAIAAGAVAVLGRDSSPATSVGYTLPGAGPAMGMCINLAEYVPSPTMAGFRGTVAEVGDGTVTLDVTHWYGGGDADRVVLSTADNPIVELDGVEFVKGGDYLVGVQDGNVLICGISGPYSPELAALYDKWFPA
jgi:hypothetical protein